MEEDKVLTQAMTWVKLEEKAKYVTEGKKNVTEDHTFVRFLFI